MQSDTLLTKVYVGMRVISADDVYIGKVWHVHFRDTEVCIEVRPHNFLSGFLDTLALRQMQPNSSHLFLPGRTITHVVRKRIQVRLDAEAVRACVSRPPWIDGENYNDYKWEEPPK